MSAAKGTWRLMRAIFNLGICIDVICLTLAIYYFVIGINVIPFVGIEPNWSWFLYACTVLLPAFKWIGISVISTAIVLTVNWILEGYISE